MRGAITLTSGIIKLAEMLPKSTMISIFAGADKALLTATRGEEQFIVAFPKDAATETEEDGEQLTGIATGDIAGNL